ncbi:MAG: dimethylargininase [bacterium]|nr:dimethylargininase [bacterium]
MMAITRDVSEAIGQCELTHLERELLDLDRARSQHREYVELLERLGCEVRALPSEPDLPDSVFVEDTALVLDELAVLMRPGAVSRRAEVESIGLVLEPLRPLARIGGPGTVDGGDVLAVGRDVYVGLSSRSDAAGVEELTRILAPHGYAVHPVRVRGCLHLKSAATVVAPDTLLVNPDWIDRGDLGSRAFVEAHPEEPFGANAVHVGEAVIHSTAFPRTRARLEAAGLRVEPVDATELAKAEGGVTCCSLLLR